ncbi:MAG: DUF6491 family protein [Hyphomonadaceae bacterium]
MLRTTTFIAAFLAVAACTTPGTSTASNAGGDRDCFRALDVDGYGVLDDNRIRVRVSPQRQYALSIATTTRDLDWEHAISIRSVTSFICVGQPAGVTLVGGDPVVTRHVTAIERLPVEAAAEGS